MLNGEQLKRVRELRGISQSMLANYLGITNRYIIYCEQGVYEPAEDLYEDGLMLFTAMKFIMQANEK